MPSNTLVCVLNLIVPAPPERAAVFPCGRVTPAAPGRAGLDVTPIVIAPVVLVIVNAVPWVKVAATGSPAVVPINNCPAPNTIGLKGLEPSLTNIPCAVGLTRPEPP